MSRTHAPPGAEPLASIARKPWQDVLSRTAHHTGGRAAARAAAANAPGQQGGQVSLDMGPGAERTLDDLVQVGHSVGQAIESVIEGKADAVRLAITVLLAEGHVLIEDVPGVGKKIGRASCRERV